MSISLTCGPSGTVITGETEEELVSNVQAHAREHENTELSRERILAEIRGKDPEQPIDAAAWAAMNAPSAAPKLCDTSDMVIVHRMFRRECALLPQLVAAVPVGDAARAHTVAGHAHAGIAERAGRHARERPHGSQYVRMGLIGRVQHSQSPAVSQPPGRRTRSLAVQKC